MFELQPTVTKELLLKCNSEETYMEHYLGIPCKKGLWVSPLRNDRRPTASFYRNKKGELIFHDFGEPFYGNFINVVMRLYDVSYYKALKIIANDFNIIHYDSYDIHPAKIEYSHEKFTETGSSCYIQIEKQEFSEEELKWWKDFGVSQDTLKKYKVFSCKSVFLNGNYFASSSPTNYIFGYYGGKTDDKELWRIYMPMRTSYRFLSNWNSIMIQGSKQLLKESDHCILVKSLKDTMVLSECGFTACSPNSETTMITQNQYQRLKNKFKNIFVFFDNDEAGITNAKKYQQNFGCKCIFIKNEYAKDISDLHKAISESEFLEVVDELDSIINNEIIKETKHFYLL